jgi:hypothetical protein
MRRSARSQPIVGYPVGSLGRLPHEAVPRSSPLPKEVRARWLRSARPNLTIPELSLKIRSEVKRTRRPGQLIAEPRRLNLWVRALVS